MDWKEALFLATRGGAMALGLPGIFGVGLPFDSQELRQFSIVQAINYYLQPVKLYDPTSGMGIGALDYWVSAHLIISVSNSNLEKFKVISTQFRRD